MKNIHRTISALFVSMTIVLLSACTPVQLSTWTAQTGQSFTSQEEEAMLSLYDSPMRLPDGGLIHSDGSVVKDVASVVNSLPYSYDAARPVMDAFQLVATERGWSQAQIDSWKTAVADISRKEAHDCWNVRYGAKFAYFDGRGCQLKKAGKGASGYGQITSVLHHITCARVNLCSGPAIVSSPYNSMLALVAVIEDQGVSPYCYNSYARRFHRVACNNPGLDVP